ncbi:MAG: 1-acyl-sn-glycerol-3-phosphate acyltransferase [Ponticaulis sp.]|nr:1-acyl-sn-glycerol-3-phosphate acyltransferase [Ponticaulis sp.]
MRSTLFAVSYWVLNALYVLLAIPLLIVPGSTVIRWWIRKYTQSMRWCLRVFAGIKHDIRGKENLPDGPFILAAKHQSWGDGFLIYPEIEDIAFVTGDHLEKFPFVKGILHKLGAIVIDTCGGGERKAASLAEGMDRAANDGRRILIYPEGHLAPVDYHFKYKAGVWHMARAMNVPVIPVATNIGLFWSQEAFRKEQGTAILEFLPALTPDDSKSEFLEKLTDCIESKTAELVAEGRNAEKIPTRLIEDPENGVLATPPCPDTEPTLP